MAVRLQALSLGRATKLESHKCSPTTGAVYFALSPLVPAALVWLVLLPLWLLPYEPTGTWSWVFALGSGPTATLLSLLAVGHCAHVAADFDIRLVSRIAAAIVATLVSHAALVALHVSRGAPADTVPGGYAATWLLAVGLFLGVLWLTLPHHDRRSRSVGVMVKFTRTLVVAAAGWAAAGLVFVAAAAVSAYLQSAAALLLFPAFTAVLKARCDAIVAVTEPDAGPVACSGLEHLGSVACVLFLASATGWVPRLALCGGQLLRQAAAVARMTGRERRWRKSVARSRRALWVQLRAWVGVPVALCRRCVSASIPCGRGGTSRSVTPTGVLPGGPGDWHGGRGGAGGRGDGGGDEDDGEAHITPGHFNVMCLLYDQRPPKMFVQYDAPTVQRERQRAALELVLVQHSLHSALVQVGALVVALVQAAGPMAAASLLQLDVVVVRGGATDASDTSDAVAAWLWGLAVTGAVALVIQAGVSALVMRWVAPQYDVKPLRLLHFMHSQYSGLTPALQTAVLLLCIMATCHFSGSDARSVSAWAAHAMA